jgi:carbon monoxide dehydrogenase subunit G
VELTNDFSVSVPVDEAWAVLTDLERIAPCMPGAQLQEVEGDEYRGVVKVKVGPITAQYKGAASFQERDDSTHRAVIRAEGRDTRGQGNAAATITASLEPDGDGTRVKVVTDLTVTGKVAQFGRGVMADVSAKLMDQFVSALEQDVLSGKAAAPVSAVVATDAPSPGATVPAPNASPNGSASSGPRKIDSPPAQPVDLLDTAGGSVAKRVGPIVGVLIVVLWLLRRRRKKRK